MSRPSIEGIEAAAGAIEAVFLNTPVVTNAAFAEAFGCRLIAKIETLGPIRSFKGRGTDYLLHCLELPKGSGVICASAGNFGQGVAWAARTRGIETTVFAAENASPLKIEAMRALGAEVVLVGADLDAAKVAAIGHAAENDLRFIEDGLHHEIAEGAGTIAREMQAQTALGDVILVPLGNGALIGGIGTWIKAKSPETKVIAVAAAGAPAMARSFRARKPVATESVDTIADGVAVRVPIPEAVDLMLDVVDDVAEVSDAAIVAAMRHAFDTLGLVVEPAGAVGLAALLEHPELGGDARVSTVLCGGNTTPEQARDWLLG